VELFARIRPGRVEELNAPPAAASPGAATASRHSYKTANEQTARLCRKAGILARVTPSPSPP